MPKIDPRFDTPLKLSDAIQDQCAHDNINYNNLDYLIKELGADVNWARSKGDPKYGPDMGEDEDDNHMAGSTFYNVLLYMPYRSLDRVSLDKWEKLIVYFQSAGGDINQLDAYGQNVLTSLLHNDMEHGQIDLLLQHGADPFLPNKINTDAIHSAIFFSTFENAAYLIEKLPEQMTKERIDIYTQALLKKIYTSGASEDYKTKYDRLSNLLKIFQDKLSLSENLTPQVSNHKTQVNGAMVHKI